MMMMMVVRREMLRRRGRELPLDVGRRQFRLELVQVSAYNGVIPRIKIIHLRYREKWAVKPGRRHPVVSTQADTAHATRLK
jgi:hypothetical protein